MKPEKVTKVSESYIRKKIDRYTKVKAKNTLLKTLAPDSYEKYVAGKFFIEHNYVQADVESLKSVSPAMKHRLVTDRSIKRGIEKEDLIWQQKITNALMCEKAGLDDDSEW